MERKRRVQLDDGNDRGSKINKEDEPTINPWNKQLYTSRYFTILKVSG
jgi:hypothetical protein